MGLVNTKLSTEQHMKINIFGASGIAGPKFMKPGSWKRHSLYDTSISLFYFFRNTRIHNPRYTGLENFDGRENDDTPDDNCKEKIIKSFSCIVGQYDRKNGA